MPLLTGSDDSLASRGKQSHRGDLRQTARRIVELAAQQDSKAVAHCFSLMPLHQILAVRALFCEAKEAGVVADALLRGLQHRDSRVRYDCAHALDHLGDARCAEPLRRLMDDAVPRVRRMALHSLSCATCKLVPLQHDEDLVAFVIERALTDPSVNVRRHATTALGSFCQDPRATRALQRLAAQDADRAVRRNAQRALRSSLIPAAQD